MSRSRFLDALSATGESRPTAYGPGTSIACRELMAKVGVSFPDAHLNAEKMAALAMAGHTVLGFDVVAPLFSVCHEAAAMGCNVNWGGPEAMPESGKPIFRHADDIRIPPDLLKRPGCAVPLEAIAILKKRLCDDAAVCGKVFGSWTQGYHYFGVEQFLMGALDDPDTTQQILDRLLSVTIAFATAQIEAGADCLLLADHATRDLCGPRMYEQFLVPLHRRLAEAIKVPLILHVCGNTADRIAMIAQTGLAGFHWDTKTGTAADVRRLAGPRLALMGGINNYKLLRSTPEEIAADSRLAAVAGINIVGPECAIPLATPLANLLAIEQSPSPFGRAAENRASTRINFSSLPPRSRWSGLAPETS
jgi:[methyl-Co(III) methanol-specific corrinoid protein]:coenzyme M methyltransferase